MVEGAFASHLRNLPEPADGAQARLGRERWLAAMSASGDGGLIGRAHDLLRSPAIGALLDALFGNSAFLTAIVEREPAFAVALFENGPEPMLDRLRVDQRAIHAAACGGADPGRSLRIAKRRLALLVAVADIANLWPLERVTLALSQFADAALGCAVAHLLADAARRGVLSLAEPLDPGRGSGLMVIGMGKLGALELNYSSDVDLIVLYDPEKMVAADRAALPTQINRLTRALVRALSERTADGYVFRCDLRLRPDPGSTPPAIAVLGAEAYYETLGQNWERAAMIKARPVAGDLAEGTAFLGRLTPFVWRKNLDFAAIQDIHSIKRQIDSHHGRDRIAVTGHHVKLGRGGIREIEFFVQTQQLIWGGRLPELRVRGTVDALAALRRAGKIGGDTEIELTSAYRFLRRVEHRLQMINDEQTHTLPADPGQFARFATFFGCADPREFEEELLAVLHAVEGHYAELFKEAPGLGLGGARGGNLVFTGSEPDPDTLASLGRMDFANPALVDGTIRGWHHGRCRAMRSTRARELLTELTPVLLGALSEMPDPDAAFLAFDKFLTALPAGVQLFALFYAEPDLLRLVVEILGVAPRLGEHLGRRPSLLDSVLSPDFFQTPPDLASLERELGERLSRARYPEERLDLSRRWANDRKFQVGVQCARGLLSTAEAVAAWTNVAEAALRVLLPAIEADFAAIHGGITGGGLAIIGMGKLGSREITAASDLDLIFVYGAPSPAAVSDGVRPLAAGQYYARLSQRLISALSAPTAEGQLYAVDMRLRPSGTAGPIAVAFESFRSYQCDQAWTWERMALTRARVIAGPPTLAAAISEVIRSVLTQRRPEGSLVRDVSDMRQRMARERPPASPWDIKHIRGGMIDIEFIAQYLQLRHGHDHPEVLAVGTRDALDRLGHAGLLDPVTASVLRDALALWQTLQVRLRLMIGDEPVAAGLDDAPQALRRALSGAAGLGFDDLVARIRQHQAAVLDAFDRLIDRPAAAVVDAGGGGGSRLPQADAMRK
jgi:glutamate-ammonia-ligase adenylyltransferase